MSFHQQQAGCSNQSDASRFSPASTPFHQTGGESGYAPYPSYMVPSSQIGPRSFEHTPQQLAGSLNPNYNPQMAGSLNPTHSPYQMPYSDARLDSSFSQGQCQTFSSNVQPYKQQQQHLSNADCEPPFNTSFNTGARYDLTPTTPSFQNQLPCTPVHKQAEIFSPFTSPKTYKDSKGDDIPKSLKYDPAKRPWEVFFCQFVNHLMANRWTSEESKSNLKYVLEGKAFEYFTALNEREPNLLIEDVLFRMRDKFKFGDTQEISQSVYHNRSQDQINVSLVGQNQPYNFMESTPIRNTPILGAVHNTPIFGAHTPVYPTFNHQLWSTAIQEPRSITPPRERYIPYRGPPSSCTSKQEEEQTDFSEQDERQESISKQDEGHQDLSSSETTLEERMVRLEDTFEKMMNSIIKANEVECQEPPSSPQPRRVVNSEKSQPQTPSRDIDSKVKLEEPQSSPPPRSTSNYGNAARSLPQTLSPCIGCNKEGHYLWDCPDKKKEQQVYWDDLNYEGSDPEA